MTIQEEFGMLFKSHNHAQLASALGALMFAGLAFAAALYPVI